jgi:hypothetical protein
MKKPGHQSTETERLVLGLCAWALYCYARGSAQHAYSVLRECESLLARAKPATRPSVLH